MDEKDMRKSIRFVLGLALKNKVDLTVKMSLMPCIESIVFKCACDTKAKSLNDVFPIDELESAVASVTADNDVKNWTELFTQIFLDVYNDKFPKEVQVPLSELQAELDKIIEEYKFHVKEWVKAKRPRKNGGIGISGKKLSKATLRQYVSEEKYRKKLAQERKAKVRRLSGEIQKRTKITKGVLVRKGGVLFRILDGGKSAEESTHFPIADQEKAQ